MSAIPKQAHSWPSPDMTLLTGGVREAPAFPANLFGERLGSELTNLSEAKGAPPDYVAAGVLSIAAGLIGNARLVEAWPGWREPCVLWLAPVGGPSASKSPGLDPSLTAAREIEAEKAQGFKESLRQWETLREAAKIAADAWRENVRTASGNGSPAPTLPEHAVEPEKPIRPRIIVSDTTVEELAVLLSGNPKGLVLFRDELAGFIGGQGRYGNADADRAFFLESWGGRPFTVDRRKQDQPIVIPRLSLSVVGGVQPDRLRSLLITADDDGLAARFLYVWPEGARPIRPVRGFNLDSLRRAFGRLDSLRLTETESGLAPVVVSLAPDAADMHQAAREESYERTRAASGMLASAFGKSPGNALRLAGVLTLLDWAFASDGPEPDQIKADAVERAWTLIEDYFEPMARRVFGDCFIPAVERHAASIARAIFDRRELTINAREIRQRWSLPGLRESTKIDAALRFLVEAGWVREAGSRQGPTRGRQSKTFEVNPDVLP